MADHDLFLRRLERTAVGVCLAMAAAALVVSGGQLDAAVAVLAGGFLIGVSYWSIGLGVHALASAFIPPTTDTGEETPSQRKRMSWTLTRVVLRYALLALLAYVMIARLRLHPIGLLAGASSVVAAAALEACRFLWKSKRAAS